MNLLIITTIISVVSAQIDCTKVKPEDRHHMGCSGYTGPQVGAQVKQAAPITVAKPVVAGNPAAKLQDTTMNLSCTVAKPEVDSEKVEKDYAADLRVLRSYVFMKLLPFTLNWTKHIETFIEALKILREEQQTNKQFTETFESLFFYEGKVKNPDSKNQEALLKHIKAAFAESMIPPHELSLAVYLNDLSAIQKNQVLFGKVLHKQINEEHLKDLLNLAAQQIAANKVPVKQIVHTSQAKTLLAHFKIEEKDLENADASLQYYLFIMQYFAKQLDYNNAKADIMNSWAKDSETSQKVQTVAKPEIQANTSSANAANVIVPIQDQKVAGQPQNVGQNFNQAIAKPEVQASASSANAATQSAPVQEQKVAGQLNVQVQGKAQSQSQIVVQKNKVKPQEQSKQQSGTQQTSQGPTSTTPEQAALKKSFSDMGAAIENLSKILVQLQSQLHL